VSHSAAICLPPAEARRAITDAAARALSRVGEVALFRFEGPVEVQVTFDSPPFADSACLLPQLERVDGRTVRYRAADYLEAFRMFNAAHFLAGVVR
jgi:D-amino peptidase